MAANAPIGIYDSGIGGLSVLRHIRASLPHEQLLYVADTGFAPYGDKPEHLVIDRSLAIADFFIRQHRIKALVIACNTATAAAIEVLRRQYPTLPIVGVEPGLKPATTLTTTHIVGVLATERTLASAKFLSLREQISAATSVCFLPQPCIGLADQVEKGELHSAATALLLQRYVTPLIQQNADTLVLGCTHYPFVQPLIEKIVKGITTRPTAIVDTGKAVARQLSRLLDQQKLHSSSEKDNALLAFTTGSKTALKHAFSSLLQLHPFVTEIAASTNDKSMMRI